MVPAGRACAGSRCGASRRLTRTRGSPALRLRSSASSRAASTRQEVKHDLKGWVRLLDAHLHWTKQGVTAASVETTALRAELAALREGAGLDPEATAALVRERIEAALADPTITLGPKES